MLKKLYKIQSELKVEKGRYNKFGNYHYRNLEDITSQLIAYIKANDLGVVVTFEDEVVSILDRIYIKATVTLTDVEEGKSVSAIAYARESEERAKFDASQLTGSASSYARKYAINALLALGEEDADSYEEDKQAPKKSVKTTVAKKSSDGTITDEEINQLFNIFISDRQRNCLKQIMNEYGYGKTANIKQIHYNEIIEKTKDLAGFN